MYGIVCDNCGKTTDAQGDDANDFIQVGWNNTPNHQACGVNCAKVILDKMEAAEAEHRASIEASEREAAEAAERAGEAPAETGA